jgi:hypothetical protein
VTVIQLALLTAVQLQPAVAVTVTQLLAPALPIDWLVGLTLTVHDDAAPSCVTVNVWPPAVIVPVRGEVVVFAATVNATVPLPKPLAPAVTVIQAALLDAFHAQPALVVTVNEPLPPVASMDCDTGAIAYAHGVVAAACVTETTCPAMTMVADRELVSVFCATVYVRLPLPVPAPVPEMVIQVALVNELQLQPAPAVTVTDALPPAAGSDCDVGVTLNVQGVPASCVMVNVWPPTVMVPVRELVTVFADTLNPTVPFPEPLAPLVIVIQLALLVALHAQPVTDVTEKEPVPPADPTFVDTGDSEYVHGSGSCVIVNV